MRINLAVRVAITGNIASGKSQVEDVIIQQGYAVYDSDKLAHDALNKITDFYGFDVFTNGKIDRKKLGNLVFSNTDLRKKLEQIIHPIVKEKIFEIFEKHSNDKFVFVSVPLLYESGFDNIFDKVIFVSVPEKIQLERLMKRNNLTVEEAMLRIDSQQSQGEKLERADFIIKNDSTLDELKLQTINILEKLG